MTGLRGSALTRLRSFPASATSSNSPMTALDGDGASVGGRDVGGQRHERWDGSSITTSSPGDLEDIHVYALILLAGADMPSKSPFQKQHRSRCAPRDCITRLGRDSTVCSLPSRRCRRPRGLRLVPPVLSCRLRGDRPLTRTLGGPAVFPWVPTIIREMELTRRGRTSRRRAPSAMKPWRAPSA